MEITKLFTDIGGTFNMAPEELQGKLKNIKAFIFDWDGVFNNGTKFGDEGSPFTEIDSMGLNLLRFDYWLHHNETFPISAIITGMNNASAMKLGKREHFEAVYLSAKFKRQALDDLCAKYNIGYENVAFVYDDILDLDLASNVGLSIMINRSSSPLFRKFVTDKGIAHYITGTKGGDAAVREVCELLIGLGGDYNLAVEKRMVFTGQYERYFSLRNERETEVISLAKEV